MKHLSACLALSVLLSGCSDVSTNDERPPVRKADSEALQDDSGAMSGREDGASPSSSGATNRRSYGGLLFDVPANWEEVPLTAMQQGVLTARFSIPVNEETATLTLSRSGGSVEANLDRWRGQFSGGDSGEAESVDVAGIRSTRLQLSGLFSPGFGKPPISDARLMGIVIPMPPRHHFIKLTGPAAAVSSLASDFNRFVDSAERD